MLFVFDKRRLQWHPPKQKTQVGSDSSKGDIREQIKWTMLSWVFKILPEKRYLVQIFRRYLDLYNLMVFFLPW